MTRCSICSAPATGVFRYRTFNADRSVEEPLCRSCATITGSVGSVTGFDPVT